MANRYWVGGSGTWNLVGTTNWSSAAPIGFTASCTGTTLTTVGSPALVVGRTVWSSTNVSLGTITGGSLNTWTVSIGGTYASQSMTAATTGASVPSTADLAIVTNFSGTPTITMSGALNAQGVTTTGATCTFTSTGGLTINTGGLTFSTTTTWTATGTINVLSSCTLQTGLTTFLCGFNINAGAGATVTLGSNLTINSMGIATRALTLTSGTFNTSASSFALDIAGLQAFLTISGATRALTLNSSVVTCRSNGNSQYTWDVDSASGFTLSASSASIIITPFSSTTSLGFNGGALNYGTVTLNNNVGPSDQFGIAGDGMNISTLTLGTTFGITSHYLLYSNNISVGTLTANGNAANNRILIYSGTRGIARTLSVTTTSVNNLDLRDITKAGTATWSATSFGDAGGNTGFTFTTAKTVYWNNTINNTVWNSSTAWATSVGGATAVANYPLPQDTAVFSNTGTVNNNNINPPSFIGTNRAYQYMPAAITATGMTNNLTITSTVFGNCTFTNCSTIILQSTSAFYSRATQSLTGVNYSGTTLTLDSPNSSTFQLDSALTIPFSGAITLNAGTFNLNGFDATLTAGTFNFNSGTISLGANTLSVFSFVSSVANTRAINFGTGQITLTGNNTTIWTTATATNFTYSGTAKIVSNYAGATGTRTFSFGAITVPFTVGSGSGNQFSFGTAGTDLVAFAGSVLSLDFTGFTGTGQLGTNALSITSGNLTLVSSMAVTNGATPISFTATSGTQTITSAGKTIAPITISGVGGTVELADNASIFGAITLTNGTFNANNKDITALFFVSNNSNTRTLTMGSGTWTLSSGTSTVWDTSTTTGLTFNKDTANIVLSDTSTGPRTFAGGGLTYNNLTIGGATGISTTTFTGNNTFNTLASTKTVAHTITLPASGTTTVANWTITGTAGNVVTLNSSSAGTQATLTKSGGGTVTVDYMSIKDSAATPGSTWTATNSTDVSNNTGWTFAVAVANSNYFLMF